MKREKPEECECCGFETRALKLYEGLDTYIGGGGKVIRSDFWFCDLCASTHTSTAYRYCGMHGYTYTPAMQTTCYVGNVILTELRAARRKGRKV